MADLRNSTLFRVVALCAAFSLWLAADQAHAIRFHATANVAFQEDCQKMVLREISRARSKILVAMYIFTNRAIADALGDASKRGVEVQVKLDRRQANDRFGKPIVQRLRRAGVSVLTIGMPERYHMHHKFVIIDDRTVLTGSYNFTVAASTENYENVLLIQSPEIVRRFQIEYDRIKTKTGAR